MADILKTYQKRLTNLTHRNKSLLLLSLSQRNFLDIHLLDFLNNKPSFSIIDSLLKGTSKTLLCPQVDSRDKFANQVSPILKNIQRTDRFIQEENGAKNLFVGYPIVEGKLLDDTLIRCPLLYFPVEIMLENNQWYLKMRENESVSFNKTFLLAYNFFNKIQFHEEFLDQDFEDEHWTKARKDSRLFRTELYKYLENNNLELNFNTENFTDTLQYFTKQTKSEFELFHQTGKLKLQPQAILGIFPQADSYLAPDYDFLLAIPTLAFNPFSSWEGGGVNNSTPPSPLSVSSLTTTTQNTQTPLLWGGAGVGQVSPLFVFSQTNTSTTVFPYPLDASQEQALQAVKHGQSIVIQGPPGTGKSQLICNLVADSIANRKTVLVVCQKKAALDVVHQRLSEKQIESFTALVHDFQFDRKNIYAQINEQIEKVHEKAAQKISLEALHYEEKFLQLNRQIVQQVKQLADFKAVLFDTSECGLSVKELYLTSDKNAPHIPLPTVADLGSGFRFDEHFQDFLQKLDLYEKYAENLENPNYQWIDRVSFAKFEGKDLEEIKKTIQEIAKLTPSPLSVSSQTTLTPPQTAPIDSEIFFGQWNHLKKIMEELANPSILKFFQFSLKYEKNKLEWVNQMEKKINNAFFSGELEKSLNTSELIFYKNELEKFRQIENSFFKKIKYYFSKEYKLMENLAKANSLRLGDNTFQLLQRIYKRIHLEELRNELILNEKILEGSLEEIESKIALQDWVLDVPQSLEKQDFKKWFEDYKIGIGIYKKLQKILKMKSFANMSVFLKNVFLSDYAQLKSLLTLFAEKNIHLFGKYKSWKKYLTENQIATLWEKPYLVNEWNTILIRDFDLLCEFDQLKKSMTEPQFKVIEKLKLLAVELPVGTSEIVGENTNNGRKTAEKTLSVVEDPANRFNFPSIFNNSLRLAWIEHIEKQYPILKSVSTPKFEQIEKNLQEAMQAKEKISEEILLVRAYDSACKELEYNRLNNLTSYRELKHQVSKKRNVWALRKLIAHHQDEIFKLVPCWLCSPETVSAIFSMKSQLFDLVIFDEASQCFAEKGIPAMFRGKQVVIVGDDKQLAPNDLYQIRWEEDLDEDDSNIALETESLLDLGKQFLPITSLTGHYRSKSLDLIDFSNQYFYNHKLKLLPDYHEFIKNEPAISYLKVEGVWEKNTNWIEANEVVKVIKQFLEKDKKNIGVITFNYKQQLLIQDLLDEEKIALPSSLFIKNIENVQGDERDIIIFSTTYAPDARGRLRMQFGSLNLVGGENRMNVAVTRAREKIVVVSSIFPHQLNVEDLTNEGAKVLKKYLEYALEVSEGKYRPALPKQAKQNLDWYLKEKLVAGELSVKTPKTAKLFVGTQTTAVKEKLLSVKTLTTATTAAVRTDIPFADLAIEEKENQPSLKLKLILTDDNLYFEALSVLESHVYLPTLLRQKGWSFQRMYSRNWWNEKK